MNKQGYGTASGACGPFVCWTVRVSELSSETADALNEWKETPNRTMTRAMGDGILGWLPCLYGWDYVVTAPRKLERGLSPYHPSEALAKYVAQRLRVQYIRVFTQRTHHRARGKYSVMLPPVLLDSVHLRKKTVLFIDDVICTGQTAKGCLDLLRQENVVVGAVFCMWDKQQGDA